MQLFYNPDLNDKSRLFTFESEESRHITKVLRKKNGDILHITNGKGYRFEAKITATDGRQCAGEILSFTRDEPKNYRLHLAVAPTKNNDRYEWFLEKATEIGVDEITPIICERSERKIVKMERLAKVVQAAMKQSFQTFMPLINAPIPYETFLKKDFSGQLFIAHCEKDQKSELNQRLAPSNAVTVLIGPEGDFTNTEIALALKNKFNPVALGANRLRTETAALVACTMVMTVNNG